jgi:nitrogen regulatory protein P-II 1
MKEIKAVIQPGKLPRIREAFAQVLNFPGMSVTKIEGCSFHEGEEIPQSLRAALTDFWPKIRLEIISPDEKVDEIVAIITELAYSGRPGDGIVWVTPVERFQRLRER